MNNISWYNYNDLSEVTEGDVSPESRIAIFWIVPYRVVVFVTATLTICSLWKFFLILLVLNRLQVSSSLCFASRAGKWARNVKQSERGSSRECCTQCVLGWELRMCRIKGVQVRARGVILNNVRLSVHGESRKCVQRTRLHAEGRTLRSYRVM